MSRQPTPRPDPIKTPVNLTEENLGQPGTTGSAPRDKGFLRTQSGDLPSVPTLPDSFDRMIHTPENKEKEGSPENMPQSAQPKQSDSAKNNPTTVVTVPAVPIVASKRSKLEIAFLFMTTTYFPVIVGWTNSLLTSRNPNASGFDVTISGVANAAMLSTFGNRSVQFGKEFMALDRTDKAIALSLLAPSAVTTTAAYQLFRDSMKGTGYSDGVVMGVFLAPNMFYAFVTCYLSLWNLYKRSRTFALHQKNKRCGSDEVKLFEQFKEMLEIHARELNQANLQLTAESTPSEIIKAVQRAMLENNIPVGRSARQKAIYAAKMAAIVTAMPIVLAVVPPNFLRLSQQGFGGMPDIGSILSTYAWLIVIATLGRTAIYVSAVLDVPGNTEKALYGIADRIQKTNPLEKIPAMLKTVLAFVVSAGLVAAYDYAITDSGLGLSGETLIAMNSTIVRNNTAFPYPSGFGSAANETFFAFWPTLALFYYVNLLFHVSKMTELSAGLIANGNSGLGLLNGWFSKQAEGMSFLKAIAAFSVGAYADEARKATPVEKFTADLEKATATWKVKLDGSDLVTASGAVNHQEVKTALDTLNARETQLSSGCWARIQNCWKRGSSSGEHAPLLNDLRGVSINY